jgi:hypothetical protein
MSAQSRVPQTVGRPVPTNQKKPTGKSVKPAGSLRLENFRHGSGWEPDRFMYRVGPWLRDYVLMYRVTP